MSVWIDWQIEAEEIQQEAMDQLFERAIAATLKAEGQVGKILVT